jgi:predicted small lipoprotein YifL
MIKKILLVLILLAFIVSCGKKGDPEYKESKINILIRKI